MRKPLTSTTAVPIAIFSFQRGSSGIVVKGLMNSITDSLSLYRKRCYLLLRVRLGRRLCGDSMAGPADIARTLSVSDHRKALRRVLAKVSEKVRLKAPARVLVWISAARNRISSRTVSSGSPASACSSASRAASWPCRRRSHPAPRPRARARPPGVAQRGGQGRPAGRIPPVPQRHAALRSIPARRARLTGDRRQRTAKAASSSR